MLHKRFDFTRIGGFPLTQERLAFMQEAYADIQKALVVLIGATDGLILQGVTISENEGLYTVTDGWVVKDSTIMPFIGGTVTHIQELNYSIINIGNSLHFEDGVARIVKFTKYLKLDPYGAYEMWTELSRMRGSLTNNVISNLSQPTYKLTLSACLNYVTATGYLRVAADDVWNNVDTAKVNIADFPYTVDEHWRNHYQCPVSAMCSTRIGHRSEMVTGIIQCDNNENLKLNIVFGDLVNVITEDDMEVIIPINIKIKIREQ
ncbi:MAG: hypothetical protein PHW82_08930 [Bacteroidales bacterium]|nr:hypothetical protein [Bacteroidales bacterium]